MHSSGINQQATGSRVLKIGFAKRLIRTSPLGRYKRSDFNDLKILEY